VFSEKLAIVSISCAGVIVGHLWHLNVFILYAHFFEMTSLGPGCTVPTEKHQLLLRIIWNYSTRLDA
jgi:hypothetical protein